MTKRIKKISLILSICIILASSVSASAGAINTTGHSKSWSGICCYMSAWTGTAGSWATASIYAYSGLANATMCYGYDFDSQGWAQTSYGAIYIAPSYSYHGCNQYGMRKYF